MSAHQTGLFHEGVGQHHYLEFKVAGETEALKAALTAVHTLLPKRDITLFLAFSRDIWAALSGESAPGGLTDFPGYAGHGFEAPATQADIWVWIQGTHADANLHLARKVVSALEAVADLTLEQQSLPNEGNRDLIGFVDGTGNPKTWPAKEEAALIPGSGGGTIVLTQTWHHKLRAFEACPVHEQEAIVGRTKLDDIELEGDDMPANSHVSRTDISVDGVAQKVYRRSAVIGGAAQHGLYFVAFACDQSRHDIQLRRMYAMTEDGVHDRLIEFSDAVTGSYFYAPGRDALASVLSA